MFRGDQRALKTHAGEGGQQAIGFVQRPPREVQIALNACGPGQLREFMHGQPGKQPHTVQPDRWRFLVHRRYDCQCCRRVRGAGGAKAGAPHLHDALRDVARVHAAGAGAVVHLRAPLRAQGTRGRLTLSHWEDYDYVRVLTSHV